MKLRWLNICIVLASLSLLTGCMQNAILVKVNTDGSGTLTYRVHLSDQLTGMMEGMGGMMGAMVEEGAEPEPFDPFADMKAEMANQFGDAATLESTRDITNKAGWKGVEAVYAFADINQLKLSEIEQLDTGGGGSQSMGAMGAQYTFAFTPGEVATLKLIPLPPEAKDAGEASAESVPGETGNTAEMPDMGEMEDMMGGMSAGMMAPMLKGMRVSLLLFVNGEIVESNASHPSAKNPNVIYLTDIAFDKVLADPEGAKMLDMEDVQPGDLAKLDIPGIVIEDPEKEVVIKFR